MKLNGKYRLYAVVGLGFAGWLLVDQLTMPAEAEATTNPESLAVLSRPIGVSRQPQTSIRMRIEQAYQASVRDPARDPFVPATHRAAAVTGSTSDTIANWKLTATMRQGASRGLAIVDGHEIRVGQVFRGHRLIAVDGEQAVFALVADNSRVALKLHSK